MFAYLICILTGDIHGKTSNKETLFMNCMELDFATKIELEHWMATFEEKVWTKI